MPEPVQIVVNGMPVSVPMGTTVAAAIAQAGVHHFRRSLSGEGRTPLCGMGICFECRVTIDGAPHVRTCQLLCANGMEVRTDDG